MPLGDGPLQTGAVFAGHRIEGVAGRGGMGIVYRATHLALDHVVALKVISPQLASDERFRRRFEEESRIAVSIRHPNVVPIHHAGEEQGLLFVTMDLIDGADLRGLLRSRGTLDPEHAAAIVAEVAAALDAAHERGLVHRDIKPGNILIEAAGTAGERVFLTDFGLARLVEATTGVTATGAFVGTLDYVAPEQIRGERVDARSDIYALGCVLFELLTGNAPFAARDDKVAKMYAHLQEEPPGLRVLRPELPGELDLVLRRALAKDPADRPPSAGDFARAVSAAVMGQPTIETERSVATGAAAPDSGTEETEAASAPIVHAPTAEATEAIAAAEPPVRRAPPPVPPRREMRRLLFGALGLVAVGVIVVVLLTAGGEEEGGDATTTPEQTSETEQKPEASAKSAKPKPVGSALVGGLPVELAHGEGGVWVTSRASGEVAFVDAEAKSEKIGGRYPVGAEPEAIAVSAGYVWVAVGDDGELAKINASNPEDVRRVPGFSKPQGVYFGNGFIWVTDYDTDELIKIDPARTIEVDRFDVGDGPYGITSTDDAIWVSNRLDGTVSRVPLDGGETTATSVGDAPKGLAAAGDSVWVAVTDANQVKRLDPRGKVSETIDVAAEPRGVTAGFGSIWVSSNAGVVTQISDRSGKVLNEIELAGGLEGITAGPESIWVANGADGAVTRIDPSP